MLSEDIQQPKKPDARAEFKRAIEEWKEEYKKQGTEINEHLFNSILVIGGLNAETNVNGFDVYLIKTTNSTQLSVRGINTDLSNEVGLKANSWGIFNADPGYIWSFGFNIHNDPEIGFQRCFKGSLGDKYKNGSMARTIISESGYFNLYYTNLRPNLCPPEWEGGYNFNSSLRWMLGIIEEAFPLIKTGKKRADFQTCDNHGKSNFVYFNYPLFKDGQSKEACATCEGLGDDKKDYMYIGAGNGSKGWRLKQASTPSSVLPGVEIPNYDKKYIDSLKEQGYNPKIYTNFGANGEWVGWLTSPSWYKYPKDMFVHVTHPRDIPAEAGGGYMCDGQPWPPEGDTPEPEKPGEGKLPTGHKYYIKATEGSLQTCWTFDGFQTREGHYNITATNGRCLKYIHDQGCWQFFMSLPASVELGTKYKLKDIVTNNKEAHNFFLKNVSKYEGKLILNEKPVDISPYYWSKSKHLYFASWTAKEREEDNKQQTWYLAVFNFADGNTLRNPDGTTSAPITGHFENGKIYKLAAPWKDWHDWVLEGTYSEYRFDRIPKYHNFQTNHRVLYGWMERHGKVDGNHKFISPCTDPLPDGSLPPGVIGPPRPPAVKPPGDGGGTLGPDKPAQPGGGGGIIDHNSITCAPENDWLYTTANGGKLNGLYYYYLENALFGTNNTEILGSTEAIANVAYTPFLQVTADNLCKIPFDLNRYSQYEGQSSAWVYRIKGDFQAKPIGIANWRAYPTPQKATAPGTLWKWHHESRLFDYPYRKVAFVSNVFDLYDVIPHLYYEKAKTNDIVLRACCAVTPGGNFYTYVDNYKGDVSGFTERQYTTSSMDIPNTSAAYSNYMSTQKAQASTGVKTAGLTAAGATIGAIAGFIMPGAGNAVGAMVGAGIGAAISGGVSVASSVMDNMAYRADLTTTPKTLSSMGGDVMARIGCSTKTTVMACDMEITPQYKDRIARYFHMFGTKQNRVLDVESNINSRYYFNYIKTSGCNISANGVPKKHIAKIKAVMDRGTTFWHLDNKGVNLGEYCVYDNVEV